MGTEDRKRVTLFLHNGNSINIVTRMAGDDIRQQIYYTGAPKNENVDDDFCIIIGVDGPEEDPVEVKLLRTLICGSIIGKFQPEPPRRVPLPPGLKM